LKRWHAETPTIAFRRGSVSEILEEGTSGFIVDTMDQAAMAVQRIPSLDRSSCRVRTTVYRRTDGARLFSLKVYRGITAVAAQPRRPHRVNQKLKLSPNFRTVADMPAEVEET
jgi:hypothetical protein